MSYQLSNHNGWRQEGKWVEQQILTAALVYDRTAFDKIKESLEIADFQLPKHQTIFSTMLKIYKDGGEVDLMSVSEALLGFRYSDKEDDLVVYVSWLVEVPVSLCSIEYGIGVIKNESLRLKIQNISKQAMEASHNAAIEIPELLSNIQTDILSLSAHNKKDFSLMSDLAIDALADYESENCETSGIMSGLNMLDGVTSGFWPTDLIIIAARPSAGKTALAITAMRNQILQGHKPMFFSLEMAKKQIVNRVFSMETGINLMNFRTNNFSRKDLVRINDAGIIFDNADIVVDDTGGISADEICSKIKQAIQKHGIDIAYIDYLQLIGVSGKRSRNEEIGAITRQLKKLAKDLNIPIVVLSQLNRGVESRDNKRPMMSDLRESGEIEQDKQHMMSCINWVNCWKPRSDNAEGNQHVSLSRN